MISLHFIKMRDGSRQILGAEKFWDGLELDDSDAELAVNQMVTRLYSIISDPSINRLARYVRMIPDLEDLTLN